MILDSNELKKTWIYFSLFCLECLTFDKTSLASTLKQPDVTCVHTKYGKNDKKNHRPVIISLSLYKVFEKYLYDAIYAFTDSILSKVQCRFRIDFRVVNNKKQTVQKTVWRKYWQFPHISEHVSKMLKKQPKKLHVIALVSSYLTKTN